MQMVHEVDEMDIYDLPDPRPSDEQPSDSIHQDAENTLQIPLPLPVIAAPHDEGEMVMLLPRPPKKAQNSLASH